MTTKKTLEQQLKDVEKKATQLRDKIEKIKNANKPKSIFDQVKTFKDVLRIAKPDKEELAILNYSGKSKRLLFAKHMMCISLIAEVLNEGYEFNMSPNEERHYPYFYFYLSSGFAFNDAAFNDSYASAASASRLCFKTEKLATYAGKIFLAYYKKAITGK